MSKIHGAPSPSPGIWASALATGVILTMLAVLIGIVAVNAFGWFWPAEIIEVNLIDGSRVIGPAVQSEVLPSGMGERTKFKIGSRDIDGRDFRWIDDNDISSLHSHPEVVRVERSEYGDVFGHLTTINDTSGRLIDPSDTRALQAMLQNGQNLRRQRRKLLEERETIRRPLTQIEEKLALKERSANARSRGTQQEIVTLELRRQKVEARLLPKMEGTDRAVADIDAELRRGLLVIDTGRGDVTVALADVINVSFPNDLSFAGQVWETLKRGVQFLVAEPREANTEGGIYPALFGTILLVLLMTLAVVPLGVVTAVYMTEYARKGWLLNLATQAVHNLAGVPSIVFGMFGLGFFNCVVGGTLDRWLYADRLPTPTFGTGGIFWASLTLALLTLPVVVVASREGLLAVPRDWRDGSRALGSTQWQTLRTIILPAAMPGILTGVILAIGRAAGEVAPLMLTGAVKLAPSLPLDGSAPFLHLDRKFMHLGFHIYDVSMQSPNVEAAKPMAFATTLVLLALVAGLNLGAIVIRRRLQKAYRGGEV
ncbi:MAG: phosphate ABC transporter permease PtsA [Acidobacteria bacterium]|nr:MAG: phosphate ABC transporter permease PtsA [Acidobacteriota bacterium]